MRTWTFTIVFLCVLTSPVHAAKCMLDGICEFVVTPERATFDLQVGNPTYLRLPDEVEDAVTLSGWILQKEKDALLVSPGATPIPALLRIETVQGFKVAFHLRFDETAPNVVRYGIVTDRPTLDEPGRERIYDAQIQGVIKALRAIPLDTSVTSRGPLIADGIIGRWIGSDFVAELHVHNSLAAPLAPDNWQVRSGLHRWKRPLVLGIGTLQPQERATMTIIVPKLPEDQFGPLSFMWSNGEIQTGEWTPGDLVPAVWLSVTDRR